MEKDSLLAFRNESNLFPLRNGLFYKYFALGSWGGFNYGMCCSAGRPSTFVSWLWLSLQLGHHIYSGFLDHFWHACHIRCLSTDCVVKCRVWPWDLLHSALIFTYTSSQCLCVWNLKDASEFERCEFSVGPSAGFPPLTLLFFFRSTCVDINQ